MGREDLIGYGKKHLVPSHQPAGTRAPCARKQAASPAPAKPARPAPGKPKSGKPAPSGDGRPHQVPRHPLTQRRSGGRSR